MFDFRSNQICVLGNVAKITHEKENTTLPDVVEVRESDFASDIDTNPPVRKFTGTYHSVNLFRRRYTEHPNRLSNASQMTDSVFIQKMWTTARPVQCCQKKERNIISKLVFQ